MVFICNLENKVYTLSNSTLNQGSNRASEIVLLAPYSGASLVYIAVTTPDGVIHEPLPMEKAYLPEELPEDISELWSAWKVDVPGSLTTRSGTMTLQFFVKNGAETIPLAPVSKNVTRGVPFLEPEKPEGWDWNAITTAITVATTASSDAGYYAAKAETSFDNAEKAKGEAIAAKTAAEAAASEADQSRTDAHTFSVYASTSATNALTAAQSAAQSATEAANYSKNAKEYTDQRITELVGGAPEALDTLKEIADELKDNDRVVDAIISSLAEKEYTFNYYDENYSKKDNEHFKHNIDTFMRAAVVEQKKKGSPFRPKVFLTDDGVNLPKHENGKDILGSIPWRQGTFNSNHQFEGHIFVRPDIREGGWSANDLPYVGMIATSKKYVDGINRQKRCIAPYSKCIHLDKRYIKSVDGEKGEGESLVFAYREVPQNVTRVCAEVTLEFDYNVPGAGVAIAIAVRNETSSKAVKYLAWFTLLENKVELKYNHLKDAVFDKVTKFDAGIGAFYNVDHDKAFTLSLEYTDEYIACYVNGTCIKKVTDHDRSYAGGMRPTLLIGPSEEMSGTVRVHSAGFGVNHSATSYADFDELQLGHLPEWSASAPICGIEQGAGVDKWNVVETGYDGTMSVNSGYVNGKIKSIVSEALSNIGVAEGGSY